VTAPVPITAAPGWWKRNRWGVLGLVPALAAALALPAEEFYDRRNRQRPVQPVSAGPGAWTDYGRARIRLMVLAAPTDIQAFNGKPYAPPAGTRVWRVVLELRADKPAEALGGCEVFLEDDRGRTFEHSPTELGGARLPSALCTPGSEAGNVTGPYESRFHFLLPADATAIAVRLWVVTALPEYARLTAA
jgi:hypothetical protein